MPTNHWLQGAYDGGFTSGGIGRVTLTVPANGTLKRLELHNVVVLGENYQNTWGSNPNLSYGTSVLINNVYYPNRYIHRSQGRVPSTLAIHYNVNSLTTWYAQQFNAGDNEIGFGQPTSYNGPGKPALPVTFTLGVLNFQSGKTDVALRVQFLFEVLYSA